MTNKLLSLPILISSLSLFGCGGSSEAPPVTTTETTPTVTTNRSVTITPVLGKAFNAEVTLESADHSFKVTGNTSSTGSVVFTNVPNNIELFMATVTGGATATYLEEADDFKAQALDAGTKLRAAFLLDKNSSSADIPITALTEAAVGYALKQNTMLTVGNTITANQLMADTFGIENILRKPILLTSNTDYALLPTTDSSKIAASRYSVLLAAFAKVTANKTASHIKASVKFAQQLASDVDDDGNINVEGDAYTSSILQTQINTIVNTLGLTATLASPFTVKIVAPVTDSGGSTGGGSTGGGSTGGGSTGGGSTGGGSTGGGSTSPTITTPNANSDLLSTYLGSYTGIGLTSEPCSVTINSSGVISVTNGSLTKSATLNGDDLDQRLAQDNKTTKVIAYDASSPNKRLILGITTDNNLLALYGDENAVPEIGCRTRTKIN